MPSIRLTDLTVKNLVPSDKQVTYWDETLSGFGVMVSPGGTKTFTMMIGKARKRTTLGRYPTISLQDARTQAKKKLADITLGRLASPVMPLESLIGVFLAESDDRATRTQESYSWLLQRLPKHFTSKRVGDITPLDIREAVSKLSPSVKQHTVAVLKILFRYGLRHGLADRNPTTALTVKPSTPRSRILTDDELVQIMHKLGDDTFSRTVKLLILTGCRRSEIQHLTLQKDYAKIASSFTKNGREHTIPITPAIASLLTHPLNFNGWSKAKKRLDLLSGVSNWTLHDIRRTYATIHARLGTSPHIIERLLNHVSGEISGVAATYNRHHYLPDQKKAIDAYDSFIQSLLARA